MMPNVNGLELVQRIRAQRKIDYVYVIMLTAKAEKHDIVAGMGAGADDFLSKPFHRDELHVRLRAGTRITKLNRDLNETNRRVKRSLEAAAKIQRLFLPTAPPDVPGFDFTWEYRPCEELGGDMLNLVRLDDVHLGLYVLEVNGNGVPASLLATTVSKVMAAANDVSSILVQRDEYDPTLHPAFSLRVPSKIPCVQELVYRSRKHQVVLRDTLPNARSRSTADSTGLGMNAAGLNSSI